MHTATPSILALTDFSTQAEHALERAALLAAEHQAQLRILYAAEEPNPKFADPFARLEQRARQLARRHSISVKAVGHQGDMLDDALKQAQRVNLLVLDQRSHRTLWKFWQGSTLDQLLRLCPCPVLVVKHRPAQAYGRLLVAVDLSDTSKDLVRYASDFTQDAELELFHALSDLDEVWPRSSHASLEAMQAFRQKTHRNARSRLFRFSDSSHTRRNRVTSVAGRGGDPARQTVVQQEAIQADLVVVGKQRNATLVDFLLGSVAQRLTHWASSDVLVVPHDYRAPSSAKATARMLPLSVSRAAT